MGDTIFGRFGFGNWISLLNSYIKSLFAQHKTSVILRWSNRTIYLHIYGRSLINKYSIGNTSSELYILVWNKHLSSVYILLMCSSSRETSLSAIYHEHGSASSHSLECYMNKTKQGAVFLEWICGPIYGNASTFNNFVWCVL